MARHTGSLHLHEEVLLLALRNDKGTVAGGVMYQQAVGGAILAELILEGRLRTSTEGRSTDVTVENNKSLGDPIVDECLNRVATANRRAKLSTWVQRFGGLSRLKHRVATELVRKGVLREDEKRVLLLFTRRIYPELDPGTRAANRPAAGSGGLLGRRRRGPADDGARGARAPCGTAEGQPGSDAAEGQEGPHQLDRRGRSDRQGDEAGDRGRTGGSLRGGHHARHRVVPLTSTSRRP